jgi:curved DNA-binding protein CbpA
MTHYDTLGVPKTASRDDIKRAYRRKSKAAHPDRGGDHREMVAVNRAYDTLSDPDKRSRYDQTGEDGAPGKSRDDMARDAVMQVFAAMVEQASDYDNVVDMVERMLKANLDKIKGDIATSAKRVTKLERSAKRLKCKGGDERNFLGLLLADQIAKGKVGIENAKMGVAVMERAREMLSDFTWKTDDRPGPAGDVRFSLDEAVMKIFSMNMP